MRSFLGCLWDYFQIICKSFVGCLRIEIEIEIVCCYCQTICGLFVPCVFWLFRLFRLFVGYLSLFGLFLVIWRIFELYRKFLLRWSASQLAPAPDHGQTALFGPIYMPVGRISADAAGGLTGRKVGPKKDYLKTFAHQIKTFAHQIKILARLINSF